MSVYKEFAILKNLINHIEFLKKLQFVIISEILVYAKS